MNFVSSEGENKLYDTLEVLEKQRWRKE